MLKLYFFKKQKSFLLKILNLFLFIFLFLSFVSYNALDSSLNVLSSLQVENYCGKVGAIISDFLLQLYGIPMILLSFLLIIKSIISFFQQKKFSLFLNFFYIVIFITSFSLFFASFKSYQYRFQMLPGGYFGYGLLHYIQNFIFIKRYYHLFFIFIFFSGINSISLILCGKIINPFLFLKKSKSRSQKKYFFFYQIIKEIIKLILIFLLRIKIFFKDHLKKEEKKLIKIQNQKENEIQKQELLKNLDLSETNLYIPPKNEFLSYIVNSHNIASDFELSDNMKKIGQILSDFAVKGLMVKFQKGPVVTLYEFKPDPGIKSSRIISLADDLARIMKVQDVRMFIIPFKDTIGIEIPNKERMTIDLRSIVELDGYRNSDYKIPIILGRDILGKEVVVDLTSMPHLLVAGTTGSGKSVGINAMILSILYKLSPKKCRLIMIDPKMLEFSLYNHIPHLLMEVITDPKKAILALKWVVIEMENRYQKMSELGVRNIINYNEKIENKEDQISYIVVFIDEMADLMLVAGKEIEILIQRLAQMARASGIHLVMATQRPSVDVITGVIKANFPTRISYHVTSKIDSRTIIGEQGAERLLGKGDMLYLAGGSKLIRIHGPFVLDKEIEEITNYLRENYPEKNYIDLESAFEIANEIEKNANGNVMGDIYQQALEIVLNEKKTSISYLQRRLNIGYNKAANIIEDMERSGILSKPDISGKRAILRND